MLKHIHCLCFGSIHDDLFDSRVPAQEPRDSSMTEFPPLAENDNWDSRSIRNLDFNASAP